MGGIGHGGARPGAGRKRRDPSASWLTGTKTAATGRVTKPKAAAKSPADGDVAPPATLNKEGLAVWRELAPLAIAQRSLTPARAYAFGLLCDWIVLERKLAASALAVCGPDHRGLMGK